jgi:virginiamycin B lyase
LNHGNRNVSSIVLLAGLFTGSAFGQNFYTNYPTGQATSPNEMVAGPDGALWFTNLFQGTIGRITTSGQVTIYPVAGGSDPQAITAGPDGALWFANSNSNEIDRITTSGQVTAYTLPTPNTYPYGITVGPDGNIWTSVMSDK